MILKLLILSLITTSALAQTSMIICTLTFVDNVCTCDFIIFNPNGFNNLTIVGNPTPNCTFEDANQAIGMGMSLNIPSAICNQLPNLENLAIENLGIKSMNGNTFRNCRNLKTLRLGSNEIETIPPYAFSETILERIELNDNKLGSVDEHSFDNLSNLRTLNLNGNSNGMNLPAAVFDHLPRLQNLLASGCNLLTLNPLWFANLRNLIVLDLSENAFITIPNNILNSQQNLRFLDLSRNELASIPESTFQHTRNLLVLDLQSNKIRELHENLFANLQLLQNLQLSNNPNITIPSNVFRPLSFLRTLEIASNNVASINGWFSSLSNLGSIDLGNNNITSIPVNTFTTSRSIESINLSNNRISILDSMSFGSLHMLTLLDVHNNSIDEVDHYLMSQSSLLRTVDFSGNGCTQFKTDMFNESRESFMNEMKSCFDKFDSNPIELTTFNSTIYNWNSIRSNDDWDALKVSVQAYENVHIALSDAKNTSVPPIEIQIGQNRNRESNVLDQGVVVFRDGTRNLLSETEKRNFIIGWRFGIVLVFRDGDQFPFMAYDMQNSFSVNFFGLRTVIELSDHNAEWEVTRIQRSSTRALRNAYRDIETRLKRKIPIDLNIYLR